MQLIEVEVFICLQYLYLIPNLCLCKRQGMSKSSNTSLTASTLRNHEKAS